jgi:hypothetical protein
MALGNLEVHHVGAVVEHLETAMEIASRDLGVTWAPVQEGAPVVRTGAGEVVAEQLRFTYSVEGTPHLELIESRDARLWRPGPPGGLHHLGAFVEDLAAESARVIARGMGLEFGGGADERLEGFAYFLAPAGIRIELLDGRRRPDFERWLGGGEFVDVTAGSYRAAQPRAN